MSSEPEKYYDDFDNMNDISQTNNYDVYRIIVRNIHIEIEEMVFYGFDGLERNSIASAVERDLALFISKNSNSIRINNKESMGNIARDKKLRNNIQEEYRIDSCSFTFNLPKQINSNVIASSISKSIYKVMGGRSVNEHSEELDY